MEVFLRGFPGVHASPPLLFGPSKEVLRPVVTSGKARLQMEPDSGPNQEFPPTEVPHALFAVRWKQRQCTNHGTQLFLISLKIF